MRYCVFCGSYDVPEASATSTCVDCARLFRNIEDSLGAVAVASVAREVDPDAAPISFDTMPPGPTTVRSLASIEAARAHVSPEGLETLKVPALSMNDIARATEERSFDAQFQFPSNPAPPRVWTQPIPREARRIEPREPQAFPLLRTRAKRSVVGLMGAFALGTIIAVGASQVQAPADRTSAAGPQSFAPETETHEMAPAASPVIGLRSAEAESEKETAPATPTADAPAVEKLDEQARLERAVDSNPNDSEALTGLGFLARTAGDPKIARTYFERAVAANPSYLPALLALADGAWNAGSRAEATQRYARIVGSFAPSTVPARARERAAATP